MSRGRYTTKQQVAIESFLKDHQGDSYTVDMLCTELEKQGISIGKATVYRCLERLLNDAVIVGVPDIELDSIRYSYINCRPATVYLMCDCCHKIKPLNCKTIDKFISHVADEHNFKLDNQKTIMYGICNECGGNE